MAITTSRKHRGKIFFCPHCHEHNVLLVLRGARASCATCTEQVVKQSPLAQSLAFEFCSVKFPTIKELNDCVENISHRARSQLLFFGARMGREDIVEILLASSADPNVSVAGGYPIVEAAEQGNDRILKQLLAYGADATVRDADGNTALMFTASFGTPENLTLISNQQGVDINAKNHQGSSGFLSACTMGNLKMVQTFLDLGADPLTTNDRGQNALMLASFYGHKMIVAFLLLKTNLDVKTKDLNGDTALMFAAQGDHWAITKMLLNVGANVTSKNNCRESAKDLARRRLNWGIMTLLEILSNAELAEEAAGRQAI